MYGMAQKIPNRWVRLSAGGNPGPLTGRAAVYGMAQKIPDRWVRLSADPNSAGKSPGP